MFNALQVDFIDLDVSKNPPTLACLLVVKAEMRRISLSTALHTFATSSVQLQIAQVMWQCAVVSYRIIKMLF